MSAQFPGDDERLYDELQRLLRHLDAQTPAGAQLPTWRIVRRMMRQFGLAPEQALRRCLLETLDGLAEQNAESATILRKHYLEGMEVHVIARELAQVEGTINKKQRLAISQLAALLSQRETRERESQQRRTIQRLGALTSARLSGVVEQANQVSAQLVVDGPPWLIALEGIGGCGKSTLAEWTARTQAACPRWDEIAWVTLPRQAFQSEWFFHALCQQLSDEKGGLTPGPECERQVRAALKSFPHLVVVDNVSCAEDGESPVALLAELASPSKFLLTTRCSPHDADEVIALRVPDLTLEDAAALLAWKAQQYNLSAIAAATPSDFDAIYAVVGGNALALHWVARQTEVHPLKAVLLSLQQATSRRAEELYVYIYREAWDKLDAPAKQVLLLLPAGDELGTSAASLHQAGSIEPAALYDALDQLVALNLVDSYGDLYTRRYTIRNLTRTFLRCQALRW